MPPMDDNNTRLVKLETSFEFIKGLLTEIRDEIKGLPVKEDYDKLEVRVRELEKSQTTLVIKTGIISGVLGVASGLIIRVLLG